LSHGAVAVSRGCDAVDPGSWPKVYWSLGQNEASPLQPEPRRRLGWQGGRFPGVASGIFWFTSITSGNCLLGGCRSVRVRYGIPGRFADIERLAAAVPLASVADSEQDAQRGRGGRPRRRPPERLHRGRRFLSARGGARSGHADLGPDDVDSKVTESGVSLAEAVAVSRGWTPQPRHCGSRPAFSGSHPPRAATASSEVAGAYACDTESPGVSTTSRGLRPRAPATPTRRSHRTYSERPNAWHFGCVRAPLTVQ
jgi:hypothetical protein